MSREAVHYAENLVTPLENVHKMSSKQLSHGLEHSTGSFVAKYLRNVHVFFDEFAVRVNKPKWSCVCKLNVYAALSAKLAYSSQIT